MSSTENIPNLNCPGLEFSTTYSGGIELVVASVCLDCPLRELADPAPIYGVTDTASSEAVRGKISLTEWWREARQGRQWALSPIFEHEASADPRFPQLGLIGKHLASLCLQRINRGLCPNSAEEIPRVNAPERQLLLEVDQARAVIERG